MSTGSLTISSNQPINFWCMTERNTLPPTPAAPLKKFLGEKRGARAALVKDLGISHAVLTNWLKRGIPRSRLVDVAGYMGISAERYLEIAGGNGKEEAVKDLTEASPGSDEAALLAAIVHKWGSLPRGTKMALAALVQDVAGFVENQTNDALSRYGASGRRATDRSVEKNFGTPGEKKN